MGVNSTLTRFVLEKQRRHGDVALPQRLKREHPEHHLPLRLRRCPLASPSPSPSSCAALPFPFPCRRCPFTLLRRAPKPFSPAALAAAAASVVAAAVAVTTATWCVGCCCCCPVPELEQARNGDGGCRRQGRPTCAAAFVVPAVAVAVAVVVTGAALNHRRRRGFGVRGSSSSRRAIAVAHAAPFLSGAVAGGVAVENRRRDRG